MQIILLIAGLISDLLVHQWGTAILLIALTILNAVISLHQEGKAEASVESLQKMMIVKAKVRRNSNKYEIGAEEIVPGDIVLIEAGDVSPQMADSSRRPLLKSMNPL